MKVLITSLMAISCSCYAHVRAGPNNTYTVDNYGCEFDLPTETKSDKIKFVKELEAQQCQTFKVNGSTPTVVY